jgi:hypothetical protein
MLENETNFFFKKSQEKIIFNHKREITELIRPINYTWKNLYKMMNMIKTLWRMNKFDINFTLNSQELHKIIYTNLKYCERIPNLNLKNNVLESKINSFFQTNLFEILPKEKKLYDLYDDLFSKKQYIPKKDENNKSLFEDLIINFKDFFYKIQKNKKSMKQLKKLRWYMIFDESNFFEDESKKAKIDFFDLKKSNFLIDLNTEYENSDDSFDEMERNKIYEEYNEKESNKIEDNLEEIYEKYIINDELIDKLLKYEKNPLFYLIKLIYLTIIIFCKSLISHLLFIFINSEEKESEKRKTILINSYLKSFNNFIDTCSIIDEKCVNINIAMNYLYDSLFPDYPKFPKFSIYRMCIRIWFAEINTHLIGKNTLLYEIKEILSSIFSETLKEELLNKMEQKSKYDVFNTKSVNYEKTKNFSLDTSFLLFKSINLSCKDPIDDIYSSFGQINVYEKEDKQYKILEKGLSIINDTFSNEYSVYFLNSSLIDTNNLYDNLVYKLESSIKYYILEVFNVYIYEKNSPVKEIIDNILDYFDNYFFKSYIIPNLKNKINETVYLFVKDNLLEFVKNKYFENDDNNNNKQFDEINLSKKSVFGSAKTNWSSNLKSSSIFDLNNDDLGKNFNFSENIYIKTNEYKKEIINYIMKNISFDMNNSQIEQKLDSINEQINLYDICNSISNWHNEQTNKIKENDKKIIEEIINLKKILNIPLVYDQTKRYLLSYSLQYDWEFIKKAKTLEKYYIKDKDDMDIIEDDNLENNLGNNYLGELDNIGPGNNNFENNGFNLKSSFF